MPFPLRGFDTDNGGEFINETVLAYCTQAGIEFTRSRPYRKNDQAWVEQKNGSVVRRLVGYRRLEGLGASEALSRLYAASRLFVNFFQPSFKLAEKKRVGARVSKRYFAPETPCARLLKSDSVPDGMKEKLRAVATTLDPLRLLDEIRAVQHELAGLAAGATLHSDRRRGHGANVRHERHQVRDSNRGTAMTSSDDPIVASRDAAFRSRREQAALSILHWSSLAGGTTRTGSSSYASSLLVGRSLRTVDLGPAARRRYPFVRVVVFALVTARSATADTRAAPVVP
jgi:hypothetical protein